MSDKVKLVAMLAFCAAVGYSAWVHESQTRAPEKDYTRSFLVPHTGDTVTDRDLQLYQSAAGQVDSPKSRKRDDVEMITECQVALNRQLKTPDLDAFSFPDRYGWTSETIFQVHGTATPVNGLGQRVPKRYLCKFEKGRLANTDLY